MQNHSVTFSSSKTAISSNPYLKKEELNKPGHFNYMAVALLHLKGNEGPNQAQIDYAENEIEKLFNRL